MKIKTKSQYKSKGKTPDGNPFMTIKQARGYYEYAERGGIDSIAFILFDRQKDRFALIYESKPPRDEIEGHEVKMTTAFGGSIDSTHTYQQICQIEVLEEAGYQVPLERIHSVGKTLVSSQMSQMCEGFFVDVTNIEKTHKAEYESVPEGTSEKETEFVGNNIKWLSANELMINNDWKSIWIFAQAVHKNILVR